MRSFIVFLIRSFVVYFLLQKIINSIFENKNTPQKMFDLPYDVQDRLQSAINVMEKYVLSVPYEVLSTLPEYYAVVARKWEIEIANMRGTLDSDTAIRYCNAVNDFVIEVDKLRYRSL